MQLIVKCFKRTYSNLINSKLFGSADPAVPSMTAAATISKIIVVYNNN